MDEAHKDHSRGEEAVIRIAHTSLKLAKEGVTMRCLLCVSGESSYRAGASP